MTETISRWLPFRTMAGPGFPLYCIPHAGGAASAYRTWIGTLPGIAVLPVQLPGREGRFRDPPYQRMGPLVADLAAVVTGHSAGRPYAVYGHSLGALVAFELLRELRRRGDPVPVHLFVSGCVAPHTTFDDGPPIRDMAIPELKATLRSLGGTPDWLLNDPSVLQMIVPAIRADFSVKETNVYQPEAPFDLPVTALPSTDDPRASVELQTRWCEQTTGEFEQHVLMGGHFAVFEQASLTHKVISEALRRWV